MAAALSISGLSVSFGGLAALSNVSFEARQGEILGIIGPNGAGKSTLFNAISGLIRLSGGSISLGLRNITGMPARKRVTLGLQRTFQTVQLVKTISVLENILLGLHQEISLSRSLLHGVRGKTRDAAAHAHDIAAMVGLAGVADVVVDHLSFREQRLTEIGRALASAPQVLLLDEPAAGLSDVEIQDLDRLIGAIRENLHLTVMVVEHVMPLVMGLCDRIAVLETGRLIALGSPGEIAADPRVIAAYLGSKNA